MTPIFSSDRTKLLRSVSGFSREREGIEDLSRNSKLRSLMGRGDLFSETPWLRGWTISDFEYTSSIVLDSSPNIYYNGDYDFEPGNNINRLLYGEERRPELSIRCYRDVFFITAGNRFVLAKHGELCADSTAIPTRDGINLLSGDDFIVVERGAVCGDRFRPSNPAHFIFDHLARAVIIRDLCDVDSTDIWIQTDNVPLADYAALKTVPGHQTLEAEAVYFFKNLLILSSSIEEICHPLYFLNDHVISKIRGSILSECGPKAKITQPIYVSRFDTSRRPLVVEHELAGALEATGFQVVTMTSLTPSDQIRMFNSARTVVAPHGAALVHTLFGSPGLRLVELFAPKRGTLAFKAVSQALDLQYDHLIGTPVEPRTDGDLHWSIDIPTVLNMVASG